jgi:hypothetical protein|tara:strand:+ start:1923 stop:2843 length:921 start_codon:yes stop_codon:yes gene_type:complete
MNYPIRTDLESLNLNNFNFGSISNEKLDPRYLSPYNVKSLAELVEFGNFAGPMAADIKNRHGITQDSLNWKYTYIRKEEAPNFDKDPWQYTINQYGFRDVWRNKAKRPNIGFYGCSNTFGEGVESSKHWTTLISKHYNMCKYNFGIGGASALRVARTFVATQQVLNLNYAVILLPSLHRVDYAEISENGATEMQMLPWKNPNFSKSQEKKWTDIYATYDNSMFIMNLIYAVSMITESAKAHNVKIVFSSWCGETLYTLGKINAPNLYPNLALKTRDHARDGEHPGPESSKLFAEKLSYWMEQNQLL